MIADNLTRFPDTLVPKKSQQTEQEPPPMAQAKIMHNMGRLVQGRLMGTHHQKPGETTSFYRQVEL